MADDPRPAPKSDRPVDLGLLEGKSLTFSPTAVAVPFDAPLIGGTAPSPVPPAPTQPTGGAAAGRADTPEPRE
jgi:hypothetical protein